MSCCGGKRQQWSQAPAKVPSDLRAEETGRAVRLPVAVTFRYTGATALTVRGPISGQRYHFVHPGAVLEVDGRDAPSMLAVPNLSRERSG